MDDLTLFERNSDNVTEWLKSVLYIGEYHKSYLWFSPNRLPDYTYTIATRSLALFSDMLKLQLFTAAAFIAASHPALWGAAVI